MDSVKRRTTITKLNFPVSGYEYNVQVWTSVDDGKTWWYAGIGKYAKSEVEALEIAANYRSQTVMRIGGEYPDCKIIWED